MRRFRTFASALALASFIASSMVAFAPTVQAKGPGTGGGNSNNVACRLLEAGYNAATSVGLTDLAAELHDYAASIDCAWAQ